MMKLFKRLLCGVLTAAMLATAAVMPAAAEENITVTVNGEMLSFDTPPQSINDRTMVPLRAIFEALGASVEWDDDTQTVTAYKDGVEVALTVNSQTMYIWGLYAIALDAPACMINDRVLVPVRAISEALGAEVNWDEATSTVIISTTSTDTENLTAFEKLKNGIIANHGRQITASSNAEDGATIDFTTSFLEDHTYGFAYIISDVGITLTLIYEPSTNTISMISYSDDLTVSCTIKENETPTIDFQFASDGSTAIYSGYCLNNELILAKEYTNYPSDSDYEIESLYRDMITMITGMFEMVIYIIDVLSTVDMSVTMADFGIPVRE